MTRREENLVMAPYRVGRTGNAELDDVLARIEDMRQSLGYAIGALEEAGRVAEMVQAAFVDGALVELAAKIRA